MYHLALQVLEPGKGCFPPWPLQMLFSLPAVLQTVSLLFRFKLMSPFQGIIPVLRLGQSPLSTIDAWSLTLLFLSTYLTV